MKKLCSIIAAAFIALSSLFAVTAPVYADDAFDGACDVKNLTTEMKAKLHCNDANYHRDTAANVAQFGISVVIGIAGSIALVFIIVGGIRYMTANGDSAKIKKAKDTILYAAIGLVICALAFAITNWIISILPS